MRASSTFAAMQLPPQAWTLPVCRGVLAEVLAVAAVDRSIADALALALTEACSNVIRHASATDHYHVEVTVDDACCTVQVRDHGSGFTPGSGTPPPGEHGGWGLVILRTLVDELRIGPGRPGTNLTMVKHRAPQQVPR